jgi:hypothetical protein
MLIEPPEVVLYSGPPVVLKVPITTTDGDLTTVTAGKFERIVDPHNVERDPTTWTGVFLFTPDSATAGHLYYHFTGNNSNAGEIDTVGVWFVTPLLTVPGGHVPGLPVKFRAVK